jgi:hypothetical protein
MNFTKLESPQFNRHRNITSKYAGVYNPIVVSVMKQFSSAKNIVTESKINDQSMITRPNVEFWKGVGSIGYDSVNNVLRVYPTVGGELEVTNYRVSLFGDAANSFKTIEATSRFAKKHWGGLLVDPKSAKASKYAVLAVSTLVGTPTFDNRTEHDREAIMFTFGQYKNWLASHKDRFKETFSLTSSLDNRLKTIDYSDCPIADRPSNVIPLRKLPAFTPAE